MILSMCWCVFQTINGRSDLGFLLHDGVIFLLFKKVFAIHGIRVSLHHLDISKAGLEVDCEQRGLRSLHLNILTFRVREGNLDEGLGDLAGVLGSALIHREALVLAPPLPFLVDFLNTLHLFLLLSKVLSSHDVDHPSLQGLSIAVKQTHMALGDGVELGHVAVLLLDEVSALGHLRVAKVRAGPRVAVGLLFCGLVGIQDQH